MFSELCKFSASKHRQTISHAHWYLFVAANITYSLAVWHSGRQYFKGMGEGGGGGEGRGAGRGKGKIWNGHIFVNTQSEFYQIVSSCVLCGYRINFKICIIYTMISQNSMLTNSAFTENLRLRKLQK